MQRLDKIIASTGKWSRKEVKNLVRQGRVLVDGVPALTRTLLTSEYSFSKSSMKFIA